VKLVSPFLKKVLYPSMSMAGVLPRLASGGLAVVTYHGVLPPGYRSIDASLDGSLITAETLQQQIRLLKERYQVISPDDALAWIEKRSALPPRAVLLTCDDGRSNCLTDMVPVLQEEGVGCIFFVTGASVAQSRSVLWYEELFLHFLRARSGSFEISSDGVIIRGNLGSPEQRRAVWWDSVRRLSEFSAEVRGSFLLAARTEFGLESPIDLQSPESCRRFGLMTGTELRQLVSAGMSVGAHTMSHPMLSRTPAALAAEEIAGSKVALESVLQRPVWAFAYPFGDSQSVTSQILEMAQTAGFLAAFLNYGGGLGVDLPRYSLPRVHVSAGMSLSEFEAHICGFYSRLKRAIRSSSSILASDS